MSTSSIGSTPSANSRRRARQRARNSGQGVDGNEPDQETDGEVTDNRDRFVPDFRGDHPSNPSPNFDGDQINADSFSDDYQLEEYAGPRSIAKLDLAARIVKGSLPLPSFQPYRMIPEGDVITLARRQLGLDLGAEGFAKPFLRDPKVATRKMYTSIFHESLELLEKLLTSVDATMFLNKANAYRLQKSNYWAFWKLLDDLRKRAKPAFEMFRSFAPTIPTWGRNEDPLTFYAAYEFEILGICYRAEVEHFLMILHEHFDFVTDEIRAPDEEAKSVYDNVRRSMSVARGAPNPERSTSDASTFQLRPVSPVSARNPWA
jgi:hypothetical protein